MGRAIRLHDRWPFIHSPASGRRFQGWTRRYRNAYSGPFMSAPQRKLPQTAIGGVSGDAYQPVVSPGENLPEFTFRSVGIGSLLGVVFGAANAYLGLKVGITVSTSIPIAVMTFAILHLIRARRGSMLLEANMSQTIGSASSSLASG